MEKENPAVGQKLTILSEKDEVAAAKIFLEERETELKEVSSGLLEKIKRLD